MKKITFSILTVLLSGALICSAQKHGKLPAKPQAPQIGKINWSIDPFEHAIFVENKGQFDTVLPGEKIFFEAKLPEGIDAYFTSQGVVYEHIQTAELDFSHGDPDQNGPPQRSYYFLTTQWAGISPNTTVEADSELSYYYTYPKGTHDTYFANVFKKITYHNLYPGIDVVYSFPEGDNHLKYTIIVHPGADLSKVQLKYKNPANMHINGAGDVLVKNTIGILKESAPVSYYEENHAPVNVNSKVNNPVESFIAHNADASKTLVIDPTITWTTNPGFTGTYDYAYDLDYDNLGNIYVYGGGAYPLQLVKLNPSGVIQWTFNATTMTSSTDFYGDFAVDKHSLECYTVEGWNSGGGARVEKISPLGALMATDPGSSPLNEMWRIESSICPQGFVVFGNGTCCPDHACMLDTTMATVTPVNILGPTCTTGYHDMALTAVDPFGGYAWTECTHSLVYTTWNNYLIKSPLPALAPSVYQLPIHYSFYEIGSIHYASNLTFNAMNGLVCGRAWLYAYNGDTLKQINKTTGAINAVAMVSATPFQWGGLDVDLCDNIYLANNKTIQVYDGNLNMTSTLPILSGTVYDLALGTYTSQLLYACGQNFVSSISLGPPASIPIVVTKTPTNCSACSGTATASAMPCGTIDTVNVTYLWSDGETTRTASHLCSGVDTVHVTIECGLTYVDTVTIPATSGGIVITRDSTAATCTSPGNASVNVSGGHPPYTYHWTNGSTTSSAGSVGAGVYCVGVTDNTGCSDSVCITVLGSPLPTITITPNPDTICVGGQVSITASGGVSYSWTPLSGLSCYNCLNPTASPSVTTIYTVVGTDANGCKNKDSVIITVIPTPTISVTAPDDSICEGQNLVLTASGGTAYSWTDGTSNSTSNPLTVSPASTTTYTVTGYNAQGCKSSTEHTVYVSELPVIVVNPNINVCPGRTVTLTVNQTGGSTATFQWQPGGSTSQSISVTPAASETYTVSCTNGCGSVSKNVTVNILPLPVTSFGSNPTQGCSPLCVQFRNSTSIAGGNIAQWSWTFGNGDTSNSESPLYCYSSPGVYNVSLTATSDSGCTATLKIVNMITAYSKPVANFTAAPQPTDILHSTIQFTDNSTDVYGIIYRGWNFGDNSDSSTSTLENPEHTYTDTGTFCVKLGAMDAHGCMDTATDCIVIDPVFALYIPSAFSPNGDGLNDVFMAKGNDVKTFEMYIFDRWGTELFHSTNINDGWNGTVKGGSAICQDDSYIYVIHVTDSKNTMHSYTGSVSLIK